MKLFTSAFVVAALSLLALSSPFGIDPAEAGRGGGGGIYQKSYQFDKPMHGYEGWVTPRKYCTYKRFPQRECSFDARRGREVCKVVGWELEQTCY